MYSGLPVQKPETGEFDALPVLPELLKRLAAARVHFGVYKNVASLNKAAAGLSDFDIIVAPEDAEPFFRVMDEMSAVLGVSHPLYDNAVPGRQDWFVPDADAGYLHLDVSFGLYIGLKFNKRYRALDFSDVADWQARAVSGALLPVVSAQEEARIAVLRSIFRLGAWTAGGWAKVDSAAQSLLSAAFPAAQEPLAFEYRIGSERVNCPIRRTAGQFEIATGAIRQLRAAIRTSNRANSWFGVPSPIADRIVNFARQGAFAIARRRTSGDPGRTVAKRTLFPTGVIVSLIGPDGVGKSTQASRLGTMFKRKFRCETIYMGSNDGDWMAWRGRLKRRLAKLRGKSVASPGKRDRKERKLSYKQVLGKSVWRLVIAIQRNAALKKCRRLASSGAVVITDRWPQALRQGYLDGPSVPPPENMKLARWLWGIENRIYDRLAEHKPTLTVHLDCDFATSNARKPDDITESAFELRIALMQEMRNRDPDIRIVDARQDMDAVTRDLARWVWFAMRQVQGSSVPLPATDIRQTIARY